MELIALGELLGSWIILIQYATSARGIRVNTTLGTCYAAQGLYYLPKDHQYCQRAGGPRAVLEARRQIMQTEGSIMWPLGVVFSRSRW